MGTPTEHDPQSSCEREGAAVWFFKHYWPMVLFGALFTLMMVIPLTLSGMLTNTDEHIRVAEYTLTPTYGGWVFLAMTGALALAFLRPSLMGLYLIFWGAVMLVFANSFDAWFWAASVAVCFLGFAVFGTLFMLTKKWY